MKIAIIGASGNIGSRLMKEALVRGHEVTAICRNSAKIEEKDANLKLISCDIFNTPEFVKVIANHDAIISAYSPGFENANLLIDATKLLIEAASEARVNRLIAVGGAGSLLLEDNTLLLESSQFPEAWKPIARAHMEALHVYENEKELKWSYAHPAAIIEPGKRTGKFRIGGNKLLTDTNGESKISIEDFAIAILDEAENPKFVHKRFVIAY